MPAMPLPTSSLHLLASALLLAAGAVSAAAPAPRKATPPARQSVPMEKESDFYGDWIMNRLSVGLTYSKIQLDEYACAEGTTYLGHLNRLHDDGVNGFGLLLRYDVSPWFAVQAGMGQKADYSAWNNNLDDSDGDLDFRDYHLDALLVSPYSICYCYPYVGVGIVKTKTRFAMEPWWHGGWPDEPSYNRYRSKKGPDNRSAASRSLVVDDPSPAMAFTIGISCDILERFTLDAYYRTVSAGDVTADVYCDYKTGTTVHTATGHFPVDHHETGIVLRYWF